MQYTFNVSVYKPVKVFISLHSTFLLRIDIFTPIMTATKQIILEVIYME